VIRPARAPDRRSSWHLYVVQLDERRTDVGRRAVFDGMRARGIGVNVHYIPVHLQPYYRALGFSPGHCPEAERYYARALTLPIFPGLSDADQDAVVRALGEALR
jgi:dTDP-4-amino-4,6-dideoxygalactose transaminase